MTDAPLSRRDFLAASLLAPMGLAAAADALAAQGAAAEQLIYVGTYTDPGRTDGVHLLALDTRTGGLRRVGTADVGANPSFLAIHPDGRTLYAVNELDQGGVSAFAIAPAGGALTRVGTMQSTQGAAPCYVSTNHDGRFVMVANYGTGNVALFPVGPDGALQPLSSADQQQGSGPDHARQEGPHAHCIVQDPGGPFVYSADLGTDRVLAYRLDADARRLAPLPDADAVLPPGSGPRHLAFHPTAPLAFVAAELANTVTPLRIDRATGKLTPLAGVSTLPRGWKGHSQVADIHVAPSGQTLYVSNRGHDSIAVVSVDPASGRLAQEQVISSGGDWPRNFALDPSGRWLLAANERSGSVVVLAREGNGRLRHTGRRIAVPRPVCLRFRSRPGVTT